MFITLLYYCEQKQGESCRYKEMGKSQHKENKMKADFWVSSIFEDQDLKANESLQSDFWSFFDYTGRD